MNNNTAPFYANYLTSLAQAGFAISESISDSQRPAPNQPQYVYTLTGFRRRWELTITCNPDSMKTPLTLRCLERERSSGIELSSQNLVTGQNTPETWVRVLLAILGEELLQNRTLGALLQNKAGAGAVSGIEGLLGAAKARTMSFQTRGIVDPVEEAKRLMAEDVQIQEEQAKVRADYAKTPLGPCATSAQRRFSILQSQSSEMPDDLEQRLNEKAEQGYALRQVYPHANGVTSCYLFEKN